MDYAAILDGRAFDLVGERWIASVENSPVAHGNSTDQIVFDLSLKSSATGEVRRLRLLASDAGIHTANHIPQLYDCVRLWLQGGETSGVVQCY